MIAHNSKIVGEGLTYDDVLLVPAYSNVLPREVIIQTKFTRNITINVPIVSAAADTIGTLMVIFRVNFVWIITSLGRTFE